MPRKSKHLTDVERQIKALKSDPVFLKESLKIANGELRVLGKSNRLARDVILEIYLDVIKGNTASVSMATPWRDRLRRVLIALDPDCYLFRDA